MIKIIKLDDIQIIKEMFKDYKECIIFGKGETFKFIDKDENKDKLFVCINDTINYIQKCDLLVCNDIEAFEKINLNILNNCQNILIPYYIHKDCVVNELVTYNNVIDIIKPYYNGNLIIYNLKSGIKNHNEFINLDSYMTSVHTGFDFIINFIDNITVVNFYGFAIKKNMEVNEFYKKDEHEKYYKRYPVFIKTINQINKNKNTSFFLH